MKLVALLVAVVVGFAVWAHVNDTRLTEQSCGQTQEVLTTEQRGVGFAKAVGETISGAVKHPQGVESKTLAGNMLAVWKILNRWWTALTRTAKGQKVTVGPGVKCDDKADCTDPKLLVSMPGLKGKALVTAAARREWPAVEVPMAVAVAGFESNYRPDAVNHNTAGNMLGIWQLNDRAHPDLLRGQDWKNVYVNAHLAHQVWKDAGNSWSPWSTAATARRNLTAVPVTQAPAPCAARPAPGPSRYNLGPVKPHVRAAADELGPMFGIKVVGGVRADPLPDHPSGLALDFMCSYSQGEALSAFAKANASRLRVAYIIWNRHIWSVARNGEGWRDYHGTNNPHTDHVHITFLSQGGQL